MTDLTQLRTAPSPAPSAQHARRGDNGEKHAAIQSHALAERRMRLLCVLCVLCVHTPRPFPVPDGGVPREARSVAPVAPFRWRLIALSEARNATLC